MADPEFTTEELATEEWRSVLGFEGYYAVSDLGRVKRTRVGSKSSHTYDGRILKLCPFSTGYYVVTLAKDGVAKKLSVHSLVAAAYIGPRPEGHQVNHKDGVKTNNRLLNLEYVTPKGNSEHALKTGLKPTGIRHWTKRYPERVRRGKDHANYGRPNPGTTGDNHGRRKHPEKYAHLKGHGNPMALLTEDAVRGIKRRLRAGEKPPSIARDMLVARSTIYAIKYGVNWPHIE